MRARIIKILHLHICKNHLNYRKSRPGLESASRRGPLCVRWWAHRPWGELHIGPVGPLEVCGMLNSGLGHSFAHQEPSGAAPKPHVPRDVTLISISGIFRAIAGLGCPLRARK